MRVQNSAGNGGDHVDMVVQSLFGSRQCATDQMALLTFVAVFEKGSPYAKQVVVVQRVDDRDMSPSSLTPDRWRQFDHGVRVQHVRLDVVEKNPEFGANTSVEDGGDFVRQAHGCGVFCRGLYP